MTLIQRIKQQRIIIVAFISILGACSTPAYNDYETQQDFSHYQHYQWQDQPQAGDTYESFGGDLFHARLERAVDYGLGLKGFDKKEPIDFIVSYFLDEEERATVDRSEVWPTHYGHPRHHYFNDMFGHRSSTERIRYYSIGILTLKIIDASTQKTVWTSTKKMSLNTKADPYAAQEQLNAAVAKMLAQFPPLRTITL